MHNEFKKIIHKEFSFLFKESFLLAVSGGVDSMVLLDLCRINNLNFTVVHCNFQLRGENSNLDEQLVKTYCNQHVLPCKSIRFNINKSDGSIQNTARELRYNWFEKIQQELDVKYVMLAHHLNDQVETMLLNFSRGCGISGLRGMLFNQNNRLRPLLQFKKNDIENWAIQNKIPYRIDESNLDSKYKRNLIRNEITPLLEKLHPNFWRNINLGFEILSNQEMELKKNVEKEKSLYFINTNYGFKIKKTRIEDWFSRGLLKYIFNDFGMGSKQLSELIKLKNLENGKCLTSKNWVFMVFGDYIQISNNDFKYNSMVINSLGDFLFLDQCLSVQEKKLSKTKKKFFAVNKNSIEFPLIIRNIKNGDKFTPFGMKGKKKVHDFLKDRGFSKIERNQLFIIEDKHGIIGVLGTEIDNSRRINDFALDKIIEIKII